MGPPAATSIEAYAPRARLGAALLVAISRLNLLVVLAAVLRASDPPVTLAMLAEALVALSLLPGLAAWLLARAHAGEATLAGADLVLRRGALRAEIPLDSVAALRPWRLALPKPGFAVELRSGARLPWSLAARDPSALLRALAEAGVAPAQAALAHPALVHARARAAAPRAFWKRPLFGCALFALLPAGVGFYAHQHIAYGGLLGEYYLLGLASWLRTAALLWLHAALLLLLYANLCRVGVEAVGLVAAVLAPARVGALRRVAEGGAAALYYASVPALLALRFLS